MWTDTPEGREFVTHASYDLVAEVAPEEIDIFDELIADYYTNPSPISKSQSSHDDPLAFGIEGVLALATPAAAAMITAAISYIVKEVIEVTKNESAGALTAKIRSLFHPKRKNDGLTTAQLQHIYDTGLETAVTFGVPAEEAKHLANALVAKFVLST